MSIRFISIFQNESKTETEKFWAISKMVIIEILVNFEHIPGRNTPMNQFETIFMGSKDMSDFWNYKTFIIGDKNNLSALH